MKVLSDPRQAAVAAFKGGEDALALILCEEAMVQSPGRPAPWRLKGQILCRLGRGASAVNAFKRALRQEPPDALAAFELAILLHAGARRPMAIRMARLALALGVDRPRLHVILATNLFYTGDLEGCIAETRALEAMGRSRPEIGELERLSRRALDTRRRLANTADRPGVRHIAILGAPYVGSTLLGILLGSLPGVGYAGETQSMTHRFDSVAQELVPIDFGRPGPAHYNVCRCCREACEVLTPAFRASLAADPICFYDRLGVRLSVETLVTSDKVASRLRSMDPLFRFERLVLYKPPLTWARSFARQRRALLDRGVIATADVGDVDSWLRTWIHSYESILRTPPPSSRMMVVNWDRFVHDPAVHFERLTAALHLAGDTSVFDALKPGHFIGGNGGADIRDVLATRQVRFKPSSAPSLSEAEEARIQADPGAQALAARLDRRHRLIFGG